jgi:chlorobactene glucosyltransferase
LTESITLFWLNSFSLIFLFLTSVVLIRNRFEFLSLRNQNFSPEYQPRISVCVPARNEEENIGRLLQSVCGQSYPDFELLVLDDQSSDRTPEIIDSLREKHPGRIIKIAGQEKPGGWLGKPWACRQLADRASGDILLFLDADTKLYPGILHQIAGAFHKHNLDVITVWPGQEMKSFWEKLIIPLIYYSLVTFLPAKYVYRSPRWLPPGLRKVFGPYFAAACGQCIGFKADAYKSIGGHESVKNCIVEDVELAKRAKRLGLTLRMFEGLGSISCRMYQSEKEIFNGLRKNFFAGFNRSVIFFGSMGLLHLAVFVVPFLTLPYSVIVSDAVLFNVSAAAVSIILLHRMILSHWFSWDPAYGLLHPLAVLWFQRLALVCLFDYYSGRKVLWKGRNIERK